MNETPNFININQLQVGLFIHLGLGWMEHPFSFNSFKIRSEDQIQTIQRLGLKTLTWDPARSDVKPLPAGTPPPVAATTPLPVDTGTVQKHARVERLKKIREQMAKVEKVFQNTTETVRNINRNLFSRPQETIAEAGKLVNQMVESLLNATDVTLQVMSEKAGGEEMYLHAINVSVLSLMLARESGLAAEACQLVGMGALFHDIGLRDVPDKILLKTETLNKAERDFRNMHCEYGRRAGEKVGLTPAVITVIHQHHELIDGSGFPQSLKGEAISLASRMVAVTNHYDNLCNPVNLAQALTPHEALSMMFAQERGKYDAKLLQILIRTLGIYPPGTIVKLSNDTLAAVTTVNSAKPLKPTVVIYDPNVPKEEAIILNLEEEPDITIAKAIRPAQLPRPVYEYLNPRKRVTYYFDAKASQAGAKKKP